MQGHHGSGSIFFSKCNLRCVFCQNHDIAHQRNGMGLTPEELGDWYVKLQEVGNVHNINLITPERVVPQVALSILHTRDNGLLVRHLVMSEYEAEGAEIMPFLTSEIFRDCFVSTMEQYRPDAYVGRPKRGAAGDEKRYAEINRAVSAQEVSEVRKAAEEAGLWRFCNSPKHDDFNL